jgi:predicted SAM-dependent methyltransferase
MKSIVKHCKTKAKHHWKRRRIKRTGRVILGAAHSHQAGWVSTDFEEINLLKPKSFLDFCEPESIRFFLAEHVWEHLTLAEGSLAYRHCFDFLRTGGILRVAVPDGFHPSQSYINYVKPKGDGPGSEDHKLLYNYHLLSEVIEYNGFISRPLEYWDENGAFHKHYWDPSDGLIMRSSMYDPRNKIQPLSYTSLIIDAIKPG